MLSSTPRTLHSTPNKLQCLSSPHRRRDTSPSLKEPNPSWLPFQKSSEFSEIFLAIHSNICLSWIPIHHHLYLLADTRVIEKRPSTKDIPKISYGRPNETYFTTSCACKTKPSLGTTPNEADFGKTSFLRSIFRSCLINLGYKRTSRSHQASIKRSAI